MSEESDSKLVGSYERMADLTLAHCKTSCRSLGSCCSPEYCAMAIEIARDEWGMELKTTNHPTLPLLDATGRCTAPPHVRPLCTVHSCDISALGFFRSDVSLTRRYFVLRQQIETGELQRGK